jgi:hypothetical protein
MSVDNYLEINRKVSVAPMMDWVNTRQIHLVQSKC